MAHTEAFVRHVLVERARAGDDIAFSELVELDGDRCFAISVRILRDASIAEDAVQQAFLLAWRELPRLRDVARYEVWLHRLLVNACYEELRRYRRWKDRTTVLPVEGPVGADPYVSSDDRDALERAFGRLSADRRAAFVLHHHLGMPIAEIAQILRLPAGTVKSRLHYTAQVLRAALEADARTELPEARRA
jgi:RNA polymerase sigma-70 factor (ECF subfamily)